MNTYFINPTLQGREKFIREGRCMQKASSWATVWPPLTLGVLAGIAKKYGDARVVDGNVETLTLEDVVADIRSFKADVIVVNTGFPSIDDDMAVAKALKEAVPGAKVLGFGVYFTMLHREAMENHPFLDFGIVGEPEEGFDELLAALVAGKTGFSEIRGLLFHGADGAVIETERRPLFENLDVLPHPDRGLLKNDRYRLPHNNRPFTLVQTGRGCPFQCTYCIVDVYYGRRVRKHSVEYIMAEVRECVEKYGIDEILFWEECFTLDHKFVLAVCDAIMKSGLKFHWAATTRVTSVDPEVLAVMKKAGCYLLGLGIESSSQTILDLAHKKQKPEDARRAVRLCKEAGILTMGHFIFGLPGESLETAEETIRFMLSLGLDFMQCYCAVPYPGTELGRMAVEKGWVKPAKWSQYDFGGDSIMHTDALTCEQVTALRTRAFKRFYYRPFYLLKQLFGRVSIRQWLRVSTFRDWMKTMHSKPEDRK